MGTEQLLRQARACHEQGRFAAAADLLLAAFRSDPGRHEVPREIGRLLRATGDPMGAVSYLTRAWHLEPADGLTVAELVLALHELGRPDDATQVMLASLDAGLEESGFMDCLAAGS
jgi:Flp pilus assembly protein TadD